MIQCLLWDVDRTLLDFGLCEYHSLKNQFAAFGLGGCSDDTVSLFTAINQRWWERRERGEVTKDEVMAGRFEELFFVLGITGVSPREFSDAFENGLADTTAFIENAYDVVASLCGKIPQYAVTNGALDIQTKRLNDAGLDRLFDGVFISDAVGFDKPNPAFFDYVFAHIPPFDKRDILIVGDSLSGDMKGGSDAGIRTCWYNPAGAEPPDFSLDYQIRSLSQIYDILAENKT